MDAEQWRQAARDLLQTFARAPLYSPGDEWQYCCTYCDVCIPGGFDRSLDLDHAERFPHAADCPVLAARALLQD